MRGRSRRDLRLVLGLGVVLAAMNTAFYASLDRLPLGIAVTVEFLGPLAVVGVLSSALPWSLEIEAMRRLPTHVLGVLMSAAPAIAAVTGLVVLGERIGARAAASVGLVVAASVGASLGARDPELPPDV